MTNELSNELREKGISEIKDQLLDNFGIKHDMQKLSEKTLEIITLKSSLRLGNISKGEQYKLYKLLGYNHIYFVEDNQLNPRQKNMSTLERIVDDYLNLSVSVNGKLLYYISEMFKTSDIYNIDRSGVKTREGI